jgi:hypothetical protein
MAPCKPSNNHTLPLFDPINQPVPQRPASRRAASRLLADGMQMADIAANPKMMSSRTVGGLKFARDVRLGDEERPRRLR